MISADDALQRLVRGNQRFLSGEGGRDLNLEHARRVQLVEEQAPFAVVLGCSDSRAPLELIFDQGLGDLFVIRVAGNLVSPSQIGSVEFATGNFGTPLVVVMGHSQCGAVAATVDHLLQGGEAPTPHLGFIVDRITPAVKTVQEANPGLGRDELIAQSTRENVRQTVAALSNGSELLKSQLQKGLLTIVGAEYSLATGRVEFLQDPGG
jgi:carbonic anhydrase